MYRLNINVYKKTPTKQTEQRTNKQAKDQKPKTKLTRTTQISLFFQAIQLYFVLVLQIELH